MLSSLVIRDFVLIERLQIGLGAGLCALTGETGAGKSILLDALGLALGDRADRTAVRNGAERCTVSAAFEVPARNDLADLLEEHGLEPEHQVVLRRVVGADGRSRAFVNDQPVGVALLRRIGDLLVEVHGQHEQHSLLDPARQRDLLDGYGGLEALAAEVRGLHAAVRAAAAEEAERAAAVARAAAEEDYLRHVVRELDELAPEPEEEATLVERRARLMNREKLAATIDEALQQLRGPGGAEARLGTALRGLERSMGDQDTGLAPAVAAIERAQLELEEALEALDRAGSDLAGAGDLDQIEERLFGLRAAARKHRVDVSGLEALRNEFHTRLAEIDRRDQRLQEAARVVAECRAAFQAGAQQLGVARRRVAGTLEQAVMAELPPLKLERARFRVGLAPLAEDAWGADGGERISFEVATNPGQEPGPLARVASGGELARLMLALKVVLARAGSRPCLVFDEVDAGIGGATADAVGERLARLGETLQVLVVTHSPQVAARAHHHLRIEKRTAAGGSSIEVVTLTGGQRREELARMLAGARVTEAARAAADSLIKQSA